MCKNVTVEMEDLLWQKDILGEDDPDTLTQTTLYLIGSRFGIHDDQEHINLVRYTNSQINIENVKDKFWGKLLSQ